MKTLFGILVLALSMNAFAGGTERGGSGGMGGGGGNEITRLRQMYTDLTDCEFLKVLREEYDIDANYIVPGSGIFDELIALRRSCGKRGL